MTRLILIRHGETDWNIEGRWQGQSDVPLNARGMQQAHEVGHKLANKGIQAIYSSDLSRAQDTAQVLAELTGLPVQTDPRLREIHQGVWEGMLVTEIEAKYASLLSERNKDPLTIAPPGGETASQVKARLLKALREITQQHPDEKVAIVTHGFVLALFQVIISGKDFQQIWDLVPQNGGWLEAEINPSRLEGI